MVRLNQPRVLHQTTVFLRNWSHMVLGCPQPLLVANKLKYRLAKVGGRLIEVAHSDTRKQVKMQGISFTPSS